MERVAGHSGASAAAWPRQEAAFAAPSSGRGPVQGADPTRGEGREVVDAERPRDGGLSAGWERLVRSREAAVLTRERD